MTDVNRVLVTGRLLGDAEYRQTKDGRPFLNLTLIVQGNQRSNNPQDGPRRDTSTYTSNATLPWRSLMPLRKKVETAFVDVEFYGKMMDILSPYMKRGKRLMVEGRLRSRLELDDDGKRRNKIYVQGNNIQILSSLSQEKNHEEENRTKEEKIQGEEL